ncbi:hypothetical protein JCM10207_008189 [Rhodosporidiobolus poonsookiae]
MLKSDKHDASFSPPSRVISAHPDLDGSTMEPSVSRHGEEGELKIRFGFWTMSALCFLLMSTYQAWAGTIVTGMYSGGPVTLFWGFIVVFFCTLCSGASLAEMVSVWPTAEGQIAWTEHLAPERYARFLRYYVGWITSVGYIAMSASAAFVFAVAISAYAIFCNVGYEAEKWHASLIFWALISFALFMNIYGIRTFSAINLGMTLLGVTNLVVIMQVVSVVLAMNPHRNSASFVFTSFINSTGWNNNGVVFLIGLVSAGYSMVGYDSVAHMSEEMATPRRDAPRAMIGAILIGGVTGILFILVMLFTLDGIEELAATPLPYLALLYQATRNIPGSVFLAITTMITSPLATVMILASSGRVLMSFAREGGLPFSRFFAEISPTHNLPVNALCFSAVVQALLVLIYIGNAALFNSLLVLTVAALNITYAIPNGLMLFRGRRLGMLKNAEFSLGRLGPVANAVALAYNITISIFLFFPTFLPVDGSNMIFAFVHIILLLHWFINVRNAAAFSVEESNATSAKMEEN